MVDGNGKPRLACRTLPDNFDDLVTLLTLQGLANRTEPRLVLNSEWGPDWSRAERKWQEVYADRLGYRFRQARSLDAVLRDSSDLADGLVVYDPDLDASRWIAVTMSALEGRLPASPDQLSGTLKGFKVREDLRGRWSNPESAYGWAIENLLPRCNPEVAFNAGKSHDRIDMGTDRSVILTMDYAVAQKAFVLNLSPAGKPATYGHEKIPVPGYPEDAAIMYSILSQYKPFLRMWGWAEPEWTFVSVLSKFSHMLICGSASNMSFHGAAPARRKPLRQPRHGRPKPKLEDGYYLAAMTTEGDAPRVLSTFFFGGWLNPDRGKLPINWGIDPLLLYDFPFLADYYYSTMTGNDYFFAGVSGAGYVFIDQLPDVKAWAKHCKPYFDHCDIDIVDCWDEFEFHPGRYETFAREAGVRMFTLLPRGGPKTVTLPSGVPCLVPDERVHYKAGEKSVPDIKAIAAEHPAPFLIPLYGCGGHHGPSAYRTILKELRSKKYEAVGLDDMAELARP